MFRKPKPVKKGNLSQFGLLDIPDVDDGDEPMDLSDDDFDLEAELAAISGGKRQKPRKPASVATPNLDTMIAESLKDIPSDDEVSGDDDDPDLLSELNELALDDNEAPPSAPRTYRTAPEPPGAALSTDSSTVSVLQDRITNYVAAEKHAKENGETSRARRFGRGLKTLYDLLKQAKAGKQIKDEDIPPPVALGKSSDSSTLPLSDPSSPTAPVPPPRSAPSLPPPMEPSLIDLGPSDDQPHLPEPKEPPPPPPKEAESEMSAERKEILQVILKRQTDFKVAALQCKKSGDKPLALEYLKTVKEFDVVVKAFHEGLELDLMDLPTPVSIADAFRSPKVEDETQKSGEPAPPPPPAAPVTASSVDEALRQRLAYFQQQEAKAKEEGNSSKCRRMARIVKQYQEAVKLNSTGRPVPFDELPPAPGHAPIPGTSTTPAPPPNPASHSPSPSASPSPSPVAPAVSPRASSNRYEKQLTFLLQRQKQFKEAALKAKKDGDIEQAKEYLRAAKGFDTVIEAARGGLPVDLKSLPLPPKAKTDLEHTFDVVSTEDCGPSDEVPTVSADDEDVLSRLHNQLAAQLKLCLANRDHNRTMGNIAEANRFEHIAVSVKQDLDVVAVAKSLGETPPKFHYESRQFSIVQCNTDLNENDLELSIVRGIAYNVPNPKDIDTYVKFEFPYPQEAPVADYTPVVKDTNSPQYNAVFTLGIQRGSRACQRVFKRHAIKLQLYSRGGWFSRDTVVATATVKLAPLENQVTIHEAFPLMDGRRPAGGSLEVKVRVRTPLLHQQIENTTHRWLVIDN